MDQEWRKGHFRLEMPPIRFETVPSLRRTSPQLVEILPPEIQEKPTPKFVKRSSKASSFEKYNRIFPPHPSQHHGDKQHVHSVGCWLLMRFGCRAWLCNRYSGGQFKSPAPSTLKLSPWGHTCLRRNASIYTPQPHKRHTDIQPTASNVYYQTRRQDAIQRFHWEEA